MRPSDIRNIAWRSLEGNYWPSVLTAFVAAIFGALIATTDVDLNIDISQDSLNQLFGNTPSIIIPFITIISAAGTLSMVSIVLGGVVQLGYAQYLLKQQDRQERQIKDLFSQFDRFGQGFLQLFLRTLFTVLWCLLFIIPGIIKSLSYAMTPFIMAENPNMTAKEAIKASQVLMDGHKRELFWLEFSFIGWQILCVFTLGIGIFFLNPYINAALAAFYRNISSPTTSQEEPVL